MVGAALRMADDHCARAEIGKHLGGNVAGEGAMGLGVAVLPTDDHGPGDGLDRGAMLPDL
jgi:hypothetical protein